MEDYTNMLAGLGLSEGEIKVYLSLLQKGPLTATRISSGTGLNRSNLYRILERLTDKKLVFSTVIDKTKYFSYTRPERIREIYKSRLSSIESQEKRVDSFIKYVEVFSRLKLPEDDFVVEVHEGVSEIRRVLEDVLTLGRGEIVYEIGKEKALLEYPGIGYWVEHLFKKRAEKGIKFMAVYNIHPDAKKSFSKNTSVRYVNLSGIGNSAIAIYHDTVLIYAMTEEKPKVILIRNKNLFDTFLGYFKFLWENGKEM